MNLFEIAAGNGTTNVAFGDGERELYVTVVNDPNDPQAKGSMLRSQLLGNLVRYRVTAIY